MSRPKARKPKSWHREEIKAAVRMKGKTLTALALDNALAEDACRDALRTRRPEAEAVIANFINVPASELWPDRYADAVAPTSVDSGRGGVAHGQIAARG